MKDINAINAAQKKLYDLMEELQNIKQKEKELESLQNRKKELIDGWHNSKGLISKAQQELHDAQFPIYEKGEGFKKNKRIIAIDDKWISIKEDGFNNVYRYKKTNGWRERSRDGSYGIDAELAIKIWKEWNL